MRNIIATIAIAACALSAGQAMAQPSDAELVTERVSYADLNLAQTAERQALERRVREAVERLCPMPSLYHARRHEIAETCRSRAMSGARDQLARIYSEHQLAQADTGVSSFGR